MSFRRNNLNHICRPTEASAIRESLTSESNRIRKIKSDHNSRMSQSTSGAYSKSHESKTKMDTQGLPASRSTKDTTHSSRMSAELKPKGTSISKRNVTSGFYVDANSMILQQTEPLTTHCVTTRNLDSEKDLEKQFSRLSIKDENPDVVKTSTEKKVDDESVERKNRELQTSILLDENQLAISTRKEEASEFSSRPVGILCRTTSNEHDNSSLQQNDDDKYMVKRPSESLQYRNENQKYTTAGMCLLKNATKMAEMRDNLDFYLAKIKSKPAPGNSIEEMLNWHGKYDILERNHMYIQWLFPIPEGSGVNRYAQPLTEFEAQGIRDRDATHERVLRAYKMMLDFYGMRLTNEKDGTVERASKNYQERYEHLNRSRHNLLRITRIIKSLGELGFERFQAPWVNFLYEELIVKKALPNIRHSCLYHWIEAINDYGEQEVLFRKVQGLPIKADYPSFETNSESEEEEESKELLEVKERFDLDAAGNSPTVSKLTAERIKHTSVQYASAQKTLTQLNEKRLPEKLSVRDDSLVDKHAENHYNDLPENVAEDKEYRQHTKMEMEKQDKELSMPCDNLKFYRNMIHSRPPPGFTVETLLRHAGDYEFFDKYPYFIHWLFPIPAVSYLNKQAQMLYSYEADAIINDDEAFKRVYRAYVLILDYYGLQIVNGNSGSLQKSRKWTSRWRVLNESGQNEFFRITRILTSLGELGYERYQVPLIKMFIENGILHKTKLKGLTWDHVVHWISSIKDEGERQAMFDQYKNVLFGEPQNNVAHDDDATATASHSNTDANTFLWCTGSEFY